MNRSHSAKPSPSFRPVFQRGLTAVEMMITLVVLLVTVSAVVPSLQQARERRQLDAASAQLATDLRHARSLAVAQGKSVRFSIHSSAAGACYVVHSGAAADCSCTSLGHASCRNGARAFQSAAFAADQPVQMSSNSASMLFDADRGTVTPTATLKVRLANGAAVHQIINIMGRVRACSPGGLVAGQPAC